MPRFLSCAPSLERRRTRLRETPLLVLGDTSRLQVRAEVQERDVRKIYPGQPAAVKSEAFPNRSFDAKVVVIARALSEPQLLMRGQRKHTDADVLEVILELDDGVPLLPGMRTDVLFRQADATQKAPDAKTDSAGAPSPKPPRGYAGSDIRDGPAHAARDLAARALRMGVT